LPDEWSTEEVIGDLQPPAITTVSGCFSLYTSSMPLADGDKFAGFTILRLLGSGGMGEVYLVDHPRLPRQEALKILPTAATADNDFRERFNREADVAAALWHPHIVAVHDRGEFDGRLWITMDFVEGTDAAALVRDRYPAGLPQYFTTEIVTAVADALDYAHEAGLLHRDVKPANILLSDSERTSQRRRILLSDFGIARRMDDIGGLTATNMTVGSISYMPPEQLMGSRLDGRADQYALAATAFQLLTGKLPYANSNAAVVISSHLSASPPRLAERRPDLAKFDAVVSQGMAKQAADRYPTCRDFARALAALVDAPQAEDHATMTAMPSDSRSAGKATGTTVAAPSDTKPPFEAATTSSGDAKPRRRLGIWITAAVICVALLVAGGVVLVPRLTRQASGGKAGRPSAAESSLPLVPASVVDRLLVPPGQVDAIVGQTLEEVSSSSGPFDSSVGLNRPTCSGAIYPVESRVYNPTGYTAIRQSLLQSPAASPSNHLVDQSVALMPSAQRAERLLADSQRQWQDCAGKPLTISNEHGIVKPNLADVDVRNNLIIQDRTVSGNAALGSKCQHTMGVWSNVVAEAVVCGDTDTGDQSQIIVETILSSAQH
jgi:serine/threonine protein kinase